MEIEIKRNYGYELVITSENVRITEDIESRKYSTLPDGKTDFSVSPKRDISTGYLETFARAMEDMICYRTEPFNSSDLIKALFDRLTPEMAQSLSTDLKRTYETDQP